MSVVPLIYCYSPLFIHMHMFDCIFVSVFMLIHLNQFCVYVCRSIFARKFTAKVLPYLFTPLSSVKMSFNLHSCGKVLTFRQDLLVQESVAIKEIN